MYSQRIVLLFVSILCLFNNALPRTLVTRLIHYRSVDSPAFEPNLSMIEVSQLDLERSIVRASYLWNISRNWFHLTDLEAKVIAETNAFFAYLKVGTPSLGQYVYMDTGSSLFWIYCKPCLELAPDVVFNPKESISFQKEYCNNSDVCSRPSAVRIYQCDRSRGCSFEVSYGKGYTKGYLGRDKLHFGDIPVDIVFGCARNSGIIRANGIFGLGYSSLSFMEQSRSSKFGYCIGNISDGYDEFNKLLIGDGVELLGYTTPLIIQGHYFINLEEIKIGDQRLDIDPMFWRRNLNDYTGGLLLDTGSTYTFFPQVVLDKIHQELYWLIGSLRLKNSSIKYKDYYLHCYHGVIARDLIEFPLVLLKFENYAIMLLTAENIFLQFDNEVFCLAILPSWLLATNAEESKISLLGNIMQQYFYIVYDLKKEVLAFKRMDCAQLGA